MNTDEDISNEQLEALIICLSCSEEMDGECSECEGIYCSVCDGTCPCSQPTTNLITILAS